MMKWESLQTSWQSANGTVDEAKWKQWVQDARDRDHHLHRTVRRRDILETSVALLLVPVFGFFGWFSLGKGMWVAALASALLVVCCLYIPWRLRRTRKLQPDPEMSTDMLVYLRAERDATQAQYNLSKGILSWYLGPIGVAVILLYYGVQGWSLNTLFYALLVVGLFGVIYLLNQKAAARKIAPRIEQIDGQIRELERGDG